MGENESNESGTSESSDSSSDSESSHAQAVVEKHDLRKSGSSSESETAESATPERKLLVNDVHRSTESDNEPNTAEIPKEQEKPNKATTKRQNDKALHPNPAVMTNRMIAKQARKAVAKSNVKRV